MNIATRYRASLILLQAGAVLFLSDDHARREALVC